RTCSRSSIAPVSRSKHSSRRPRPSAWPDEEMEMAGSRYGADIAGVGWTLQPAHQRTNSVVPAINPSFPKFRLLESAINHVLRTVAAAGTVSEDCNPVSAVECAYVGC